MNLKEIKDKYPKADKLYSEWMRQSWPLIDINGGCCSLCDRWLYDFFDAHGIVINLHHRVRKKLWGYSIMHYNGEISDSAELEFVYKPRENTDCDGLTVIPTRIEAETAAFTIAFEILEKQQEA